MMINSRPQPPVLNSRTRPSIAPGATTPAPSGDSVQLGGSQDDTLIKVPARVVRAAHRNQVVALGISAMGLTAAATGHPALGIAATVLGVGCFATLKNLTDNLK